MDLLLNFFLRSITIILQLVFMGCFLFLYIKTKSNGVILIWITLLIGRIFNWLTFRIYLNVVRDSSRIGNMGTIEFYSIVSSITTWLVLLLCSCGIIIIYNEWKQGKFQNTLAIDKPKIDTR